MKLVLFLSVTNHVDDTCVHIYRMEAAESEKIPAPLYAAGYTEDGYYFHDNSPEEKLQGPFGAIGTALHCWMNTVENETEEEPEMKFSTHGLNPEQARWLTPLMKAVPDDRQEKPLIPDMFKDLMAGIEKATWPGDRRKCDGTIIVRARQLRWMTEEVLDVFASYRLGNDTLAWEGDNVADIYKSLLNTYVGKRVSPADIAARVLYCKFGVN